MDDVQLFPGEAILKDHYLNLGQKTWSGFVFNFETTKVILTNYRLIIKPDKKSWVDKLGDFLGEAILGQLGANKMQLKYYKHLANFDPTKGDLLSIPLECIKGYRTIGRTLIVLPCCELILNINGKELGFDFQGIYNILPAEEFGNMIWKARTSLMEKS